MIEHVIAAVVAIGLAAAVATLCLGGAFAHYGWNFGGPRTLRLLYACYGTVLVASLLALVLVDGSFQILGVRDMFKSMSVIVAVVVLINGIVWHGVWSARRTLGLTRSIRARINRRPLDSQ